MSSSAIDASVRTTILPFSGRAQPGPLQRGVGQRPGTSRDLSGDEGLRLGDETPQIIGGIAPGRLVSATVPDVFSQALFKALGEVERKEFAQEIRPDVLVL